MRIARTFLHKRVSTRLLRVVRFKYDPLSAATSRAQKVFGGSGGGRMSNVRKKKTRGSATGRSRPAVRAYIHILYAHVERNILCLIELRQAAAVTSVILYLYIIYTFEQFITIVVDVYRDRPPLDCV